MPREGLGDLDFRWVVGSFRVQMWCVGSLVLNVFRFVFHHLSTLRP